MKIDPYCQRRNCSPLKCTFQQCIDCVGIARRSSARGRQTTVRWQKQDFMHTRLSRAYLALARLSCREDLLLGPVRPLWCFVTPPGRIPRFLFIQLKLKQQGAKPLGGWRRNVFGANWRSGVTKHRTGPKHGSFRDLFTQISNILQQPAGMAVPKYINRRCKMLLDTRVRFRSTGWSIWHSDRLTHWY